GRTFMLMADARHEVERWNEQISLLCNVEGAKLLSEGPVTAADGAPANNVQAIFRAHAAPHPRRVRDLERFVADLVRARGLDDTWRWRRGDESLAAYLARLPEDGDDGRLAQAIHRQAMVINARSE